MTHRSASPEALLRRLSFVQLAQAAGSRRGWGEKCLWRGACAACSECLMPPAAAAAVTAAVVHATAADGTDARISTGSVEQTWRRRHMTTSLVAFNVSSD